MKVLVLTPDLSNRGGVANIYKALRLDKISGVEYFFVNRKTNNLLAKIAYSFMIYIHFLIKSIGFKLIHINPSLNSKSFYRDMIFIFISLLFHKKIIIYIHGWDEVFYKSIKTSKFKTFLFRQTYAKVDRVIVLSKEFENKLIQLGVSNKITFHVETTVADSSYIDNFSLQDKIESFETRVNCLFISRILKEKGVFVAIDAFVSCQSKINNRDMVFYIAGDGDDLEAAKQYVAQNEYTNIIFLGRVDGREKAEILEKSHIMLFPTCYGEGLPCCILEGMLYGMPIISRYNAGIPDIVKHDINGYLTHEKNSDIFSEYLCRLINNSEAYNNMAHANHVKAMDLFTTEKVKDRLIAIYGEVVSG